MIVTERTCEEMTTHFSMVRIFLLVIYFKNHVLTTVTIIKELLQLHAYLYYLIMDNSLLISCFSPSIFSSRKLERALTTVVDKFSLKSWTYSYLKLESSCFLFIVHFVERIIFVQYIFISVLLGMCYKADAVVIFNSVHVFLYFP